MRPAVLVALFVGVLCLAPSRGRTVHAQTTPTLPEVWQCETVVHAIVEFHRARLELRSDGTFELHHTHTSPQNGWSTWISGSWVRSATEVVLTPVSALRRVWIGDMHRQDHGEDVGARQWEEPVPTTPWRLRVGDGAQGASLLSSELGTHLYRSSAPLACDGTAPPRRAPR